MIHLDGYTNNTCSFSNSFCDSMIETTKAMLNGRKPVILTAFYTLTNVHTWIIDGAKYSNDEYLVHCNWGWSGKGNGYFHTNCFNPQCCVELDGEEKTSNSEYNWGFYLNSYDLQ